MSILDKLNSLFDDALDAVYHRQAFDATKARKTLLKQSERARKQWSEGKQPRGENKWWGAQNNVVKFTPNLDGTALLTGKNTLPAERFGDALKHFDDAVNAGEFDKQLEAASSGTSTNKLGVTTSKRGGTRGPSAAWAAKSPEEKAAIIAKRNASRKANK